MFSLKIIIASTRPGRKGPSIGAWIHEVAKQHGAFEVTLLDLAIINLPFFDEPFHPRLQKYQHEHTKNWSTVIDNADAFIIVTPEYNFGYTAPLKNALDFLYNEWNYKPIAFVSYGGVAGGTRCVQMLKQVVTAQKMMPVTEAVQIPFFTTHFNEHDVFVANEGIQKSAEVMLAELEKWAGPLKTMRVKNKY
ncbi:MAG: NADPH-dependent reductase [Ferruginibacter sp.]|nr:NADPH-dependent reductase [Ferruginibacter sp.]